jgi:hypothetical protein
MMGYNAVAFECIMHSVPVRLDGYAPVFAERLTNSSGLKSSFVGHGRWETQIDDTLKAFVERQNVAHYIDQLKIETDPVQRDMLLKLLAEEEAKQIKASN